MRRGTPAAELFGEYIRKLRLARNLTLREVAEPMGVSAATIYQYETGVRACKENRLSSLAKRLGVSEFDLYSYWRAVQNMNPDGPVQRKSRSTIKVLELEELIQTLTGAERSRVYGYIEAVLENRN